ncbi:uncharacterized protein F4817DRAFT_334803 [Daldinia loculata]|uniref:uncharacterized protein n=1 Tax=Daldinia loculata TaxID=103429 RepID=UPI0020C43F8C|nr:uncharacterized protein F4817DRAFT_334803 [Daldinia loculata]KAI1648388.1 hypothetical protein F4817DRAFT_334803 [Daldinia loculata]
MDDPWGSPWALPETTAKNDHPTPSPPKNLLSPPPRAFFGSASNFQSQSPWATEDGLGDWTGTEQTDVAANAVDWGVWAEPSSLISQPSSRPDEFGKRSSVALPSSAATSPGLRPLPRSRTSSVYRHHSPDPWATELSLHDRKDDSSTPVNALGISSVDSQHELNNPCMLEVPKQDTADIQETREDNTRLKEEGEQTPAGGLQVWELPSPSSDIPKRQDSGFDSAPKIDIQDALSRPPSTISLNSSNGLDHQDSPITSIDEDTRSRLQNSSRKASGKVQDLVGMYDGLATIPTEEPSASTRLEPPSGESRRRSRSPSQIRSTGEDTDFGDFEDVRSEDIEPAFDSNTPLAAPKRLYTPTPRSEDTSTEDHISEPLGHNTASAATVSVPVQQLIDKFGPIQFDIDFQLVDKLFPDLAQGLKEDGNARESSDVPDQIIRDSFTTISERKTWYRLSRYGSMRKHDSGDDDNYHRVEWPTSRLHGDVIKIIRRWMEEDSISGRVTLGAGIRTSVFNWGSSAAPVDLGKVFARKVSTTHLRNASLPAVNHSLEQPAHSASSHPKMISIKSPIKPPDMTPKSRPASIPSFNWSSDTQSSPITHSIASNDDGGDHVSSTHRTISATAVAETTIHTVIQAPVQLCQGEASGENEEDDWGEMVSSPRVESQHGSTLMIQSMSNTNSAPLTSASSAANTPTIDAESVSMAQSSSSMSKPSISIPKSTPPPAQIPNQPASLTVKTSKIDPWRNADFSTLEGVSTQTPKSSRQDTWPPADFPISESPALGSTPASMHSPVSKSRLSLDSHDRSTVQASMNEVKKPRAPLKAVLGPIENKTDKRDQENVIKSIVQNLPDLSYMLR